MDSVKAGRLLEKAEDRLSEAMNDLLALGSGGDYSSSIEQAASILQAIRQGWEGRVDSAVFGPRLQSLQLRASSVSQLLDSAAVLYMGGLAGHSSDETGYGVDGVVSRISGERSIVLNG